MQKISIQYDEELTLNAYFCYKIPNMPNDKKCPFCKAENNCMILSNNPCWCVKADIPSQLIDLVPADVQRKSCICSSCIAAYHKNPIAFTSMLKETKSSR